MASHIDSPRLDLKQYPLYEDTDLAFLKTHYYGGIKKYQWLARPLAIHGVVLKADGSRVQLNIGEDPNDPVFSVLDLLPHLARKLQMDKKVRGLRGGKAQCPGGVPAPGRQLSPRSVSNSILDYLEDQYGIREQDLISAELEVVPAGPARVRSGIVSWSALTARMTGPARMPLWPLDVQDLPYTRLAPVLR